MRNRIIIEKDEESNKQEIRKIELNTQPIKHDNFIFLNIKRGVKKKVFVNEIVCCQADGNYTTFYFANSKKSSLYYTLSVVENFLKEFNFLRASRSYIINPAHIDEINFNSKSSIILTNDIKLDVSKSKIKEIEQFLALNYKCFT